MSHTHSTPIDRIGTHDGTFHCDEALACFMLQQLHPQAQIVRTRDAAKLQELPCVVDVGAVYDLAQLRFDHHQRGFIETLSEKHVTKLSSAGLVYKHFGKSVIEALLSKSAATTPAASSVNGATSAATAQQSTKLNATELECVYQKVYTHFIESIDAIDNGISQYPATQQPAYKISTDLSSRVGWLNPDWNETAVTREEIDTRFLAAVQLTGSELRHFVHFYAFSWLPARRIVQQALTERFQHDPSGRILVLNDYTLWKTHLLELEAEQQTPEHQQVAYVLYEDSNKSWRIQCVPKHETSFESRLPLPEPWRGVRDEQLSALTGIPGCVFVHAAGFIGGAKTKEATHALAISALQLADEAQQQSKKQKTSST